ncbi:MAG: TIGR04438 family Trp-rich protein [Betaproteobacteria bacterium]|jgi:small Trp-rich protein
MWLVWLGVILIGLKLARIAVFADLSWWWIALPFALAFVWFQIEERLGLDRKKAIDDVEKAKRERIRKAFGRKTVIRIRK